MLTTMPTGTVKWFDHNKGFGFITPDDGSDELFAHFSSIVVTTGYRSLEEHDRVRYDVGPGKKGPEAANISIIR